MNSSPKKTPENVGQSLAEPMPWSRRIAVALACGVSLFAIGLAFHLGTSSVSPSLSAAYENAAVFRPWQGWTSKYMAVHPFGFGVAFAGGYLALRTRGGVSRGCRGGVAYGAGVFAVGALPVYLLAFASLQIPCAVMAAWLLQGACQYLAAGAVAARVAG